MTASLSKPRVVATSRQTRFNPLVQGDASEVDLNDVNISIAEREILVDARVRLKNGIKYGLIGRNGCGKSSEWDYPLAWSDSLMSKRCCRRLPISSSLVYHRRCEYTSCHKSPKVAQRIPPSLVNALPSNECWTVMSSAPTRYESVRVGESTLQGVLLC